MDLEGKIVLVTGGGGRLGSSVAAKFADTGAGVYITTRKGRGACPADLSGRVIPVVADVTSPVSVAGLFRTIARKSKKADILVNTVGGFSATGPVSDTDPADWDGMMSVNLKSVFLCCREFLRQKGLKGYGRIFNIAAQTVFRPSKNRAAYAVSKGGVAALTTLLGEELRGTGITVNAVAPSILDTPENRRSMPGADFSAWVDPAAVADEILHLCAPAASSINGAVIPMFGGV
jgi:NAD(P)-dependent dehydrogenase (short-subunit alcohol dehydrogenase family)